jgi:phage-related protein
MPKVVVVFFKEKDGSVPFKKWLDNQVSRRDRRAAAKCAVRLELLRDQGGDLRRPYADYLRDGIHELRVEFGGVNYRILYFLHGSEIVVVTHGLTKEAEVPAKEIKLAVERRKLFELDPERYRYEE